MPSEGHADLAHAPLVHYDRNQTTDRAEWLAIRGGSAPAGRGLFVNNPMIALQAAQDIASSVPFRVVIHPRASAGARLFASWLLRDASAGGAQVG